MTPAPGPFSQDHPAPSQERIAAGFALAGLMVVWALALLPCVLWVGLSRLSANLRPRADALRPPI